MHTISSTPSTTPSTTPQFTELPLVIPEKPRQTRFGDAKRALWATEGTNYVGVTQPRKDRVNRGFTHTSLESLYTQGDLKVATAIPFFIITPITATIGLLTKPLGRAGKAVYQPKKAPHHLKEAGKNLAKESLKLTAALAAPVAAPMFRLARSLANRPREFRFLTPVPGDFRPGSFYRVEGKKEGQAPGGLYDITFENDKGEVPVRRFLIKRNVANKISTFTDITSAVTRQDAQLLSSVNEVWTSKLLIHIFGEESFANAHLLEAEGEVWVASEWLPNAKKMNVLQGKTIPGLATSLLGAKFVQNLDLKPEHFITFQSSNGPYTTIVDFERANVMTVHDEQYQDRSEDSKYPESLKYWPRNRDNIVKKKLKAVDLSFKDDGAASRSGLAGLGNFVNYQGIRGSNLDLDEAKKALKKLKDADLASIETLSAPYEKLLNDLAEKRGIVVSSPLPGWKRRLTDIKALPQSAFEMTILSETIQTARACIRLIDSIVS